MSAGAACSMVPCHAHPLHFYSSEMMCLALPCPRRRHPFARARALPGEQSRVRHWTAPPWQRDAAGSTSTFSSPSTLPPLPPRSPRTHPSFAPIRRSAGRVAPRHGSERRGASPRFAPPCAAAADAASDRIAAAHSRHEQRRRGRHRCVGRRAAATEAHAPEHGPFAPDRPRRVRVSCARGPPRGESPGARGSEARGDADAAVAAAVLRQPLSEPLGSLPPPDICLTSPPPSHQPRKLMTSLQ